MGELLKSCKTLDDVAKLKILDPACGSGSFLIGAFDRLIEWHEAYFMANPGKARRSAGRGHVEDLAYEVPRPDKELPPKWRLTTRMKGEIAKNNLYGVDLDRQATEVAQMSLYLKILEGAGDEPQGGLTLLPDLKGNVVCGNSLIGTDFYSQYEIDMDDMRALLKINAFDWADEFTDIIAGGGFDAAIGNPPYVRQESLGQFKPYFESHYSVYAGTADLYTYFIQRAVDLLRPGGRFGYIVANKWMRAGYGKALREWLQLQGLELIVDFGDLPIFKPATTYPCIILIEKGKSTKEFRAVEIKTEEFQDFAALVEEQAQAIDRTRLSPAGWSLVSTKAQDLLEKLRHAGIPLGEYVRRKIFRGVLTGLNEAFVIDTDTRNRLVEKDPKCEEIIKPFLAGRDVKRYVPPRSNRWLIFARRGIDIDSYPSVKAHLLQFKDRLMPKPKGWDGEKWGGRKPGSYEWYELQDAIDYYREFEKPKIIYPNICKAPEFAADLTNLYTNQKCFICSKFGYDLLAVMNSCVFSFLYATILPKLRGGFYEPSWIFLEHFPVPKGLGSSEQSDALAKAAEDVTSLYKSLSTDATEHLMTARRRNISAKEKEIDNLVYKLYGLSREEIEIVEGGG